MARTTAHQIVLALAASCVLGAFGATRVAQATETFDVIFVIDGSGSISEDLDTGAFALQKEGIANCLVGDRAFIPHDGKCAIAIIQVGTDDFIQIGGNVYGGVSLHVPLTIIDSLAEAQAIADLLTSTTPPNMIPQGQDRTPLDEGLEATLAILRTYAQGTQHFVVVSTDAGADQIPCLEVANTIREGDPAPNYRPQGKICTVLVDEPCYDPDPWNTPNCFLRRLANTSDSANNCAQPPAGREHPDQPEGRFSCATDASDYPPLLDSYVEDFVLLCKECACEITHAGEGDCDGGGVPDICESGDCQLNGVFDVCDIFYGTSTDCNGNRIPDECDPDCNDNAVPDDCDIAADPGLDGDGNGILDQCQILRVDMNAPTVKPRTGFTWERAYLTLQEALTAAANSGGRIKAIYVAEGTYKPGTARESTFQLLSGVVISGGFAGSAGADPCERHTKKHVTVLSGDIGTPGNLADNCYHVVTGSGTDSTAVLDGFTIIGGNADGTGIDANGGGMIGDAGSPTVRNCRFVGNHAHHGGGLACVNGFFGLEAHLVNCVFSGNQAQRGGAIDIDMSSANVNVQNCTIVHNTASVAGGGIFLASGGLAVQNSIVWDNQDGSSSALDAQIRWLESSWPDVRYSCVDDGARANRGNPLDGRGRPCLVG